MSRVATAPVLMSSWSANVDLPWSICAMIEKLRIRSVGTYSNAHLKQDLTSQKPHVEYCAAMEDTFATAPSPKVWAGASVAAAAAHTMKWEPPVSDLQSCLRKPGAEDCCLVARLLFQADGQVVLAGDRGVYGILGRCTATWRCPANAWLSIDRVQPRSLFMSRLNDTGS